MSFLLVYEFVVVEILLVVLLIGYIIFHFFSEAILGYFKLKKTMRPRKYAANTKKAPAPKSKKKVVTQEAKTIKTPKKKLTAAEIEEVESITKKAQAKCSIGEFEEAKNLVIQGLVIDKHNRELNCILAEYYERHNEHQKAELIYKDLIVTHEPKDAQLYIYLGNILLLQKKDKLAYEIFKKGLKREKNNVDLLQILAELGYRLKEFEQTLEHCQAIVKRNPRDIMALEILAQSYLQLDEDQKSYDTFLKLKSLDPYNEKVQKWVKKLEAKLGVPKE